MKKIVLITTLFFILVNLKVIAQDKNVNLNTNQDWEKIQVVNLGFDVSNFEKGEEIVVYEYGGIKKTVESKILREIKKIAASKGYHTVVISSKNITRRTVHSDKNGRRYKSSITAVGYTN